MDNYKMRIERRYDSSWFTDKIISNKRLIFALIYYFVGHLFIVPSITIFFLSSFTSLSVEQISDVFQMYSDTISGLIIIIILWPLIYDNLIRFSQRIFKTILDGAKWYVPSILMNAVLSYAVIILTGIEESTNQAAVVELLNSNFWAMVIPAVIVAPFIEEFIFRGVIFRSLRKHGFLPSALASGFLFGLLHCTSDLFSGNWAGLCYIFVYMSMGMFMCKAYDDSENLFGAVSLHFINNLLSVVLLMI